MSDKNNIKYYEKLLYWKMKYTILMPWITMMLLF